jgi:hypothetical protein
MSAVMPSWKTGASQASVRRRAIVFRIEVSGLDLGRSGCGGGRDRRCRCTYLGALDVLGDDSPFGAGAGEGSEVDPALARDPAGQRRGLDAAVAARRYGFLDLGRLLCASPPLSLLVALRAGRAFLLLGLSDLLCGLALLDLDLLALLADHGDRLADGHFPFLNGDLEQDPGEVGLDLLGDLVGVELVERLALLHLVALGLEPLDDRPGLHPLAEPRQLHLIGHCETPSS